MEAKAQVKERPIIFNGEMVRALLEGRKSQTRRTRGLKKVNADPGAWQYHGVDPFGEHAGKWLFSKDGGGTQNCIHIKCPYGAPGDFLWVRETWGHNGCLTCPVHYKASDPDWVKESSNPYSRWRSPLHMPRWASRILLEITDIRVERVQDISIEDCRKEGSPEISGLPIYHNHGERAHLIWFEDLWDSINEKKGYGWDVNPFVWVIEFRKVES